jgi:hypothetical protein
MALACGDTADRTDRGKTRTGPETFTFFELGRHSRFSEQVRRELSEKLGNDAIEHRSIIDLEINYKGFLDAYLPELDILNRRLNHPPGERVDHDVAKLTYRYARKKNIPFDYIELVFDGRSREPLVFRIRFKEDEAGTIEALQTKYGPPQIETGGADGSQALIWRKERDYLIVSLVPDQFGTPIRHITIVFTENIEALIASHQALQESKSKRNASSEKSAF